MKKIVSILRWILLGLLVPGVITVLAYLVYPISYALRKSLRRWRYGNKRFLNWLVVPLWIFLDDEAFYMDGHEFGPDWWREAKDLHLDTTWQRFKVAYLWAVVRNPAWNMYYLIRPKLGDRVLVSSKGELTKNGHPDRASVWDFAVLKYVDASGEYKDNKGEYLSLTHSILGSIWTWYKVKNRLYWRTSYAGYSYWLDRWIEFQAGTNDRRYTLRFKIKKTKVHELDAPVPKDKSPKARLEISCLLIVFAPILALIGVMIFISRRALRQHRLPFSPPQLEDAQDCKHKHKYLKILSQNVNCETTVVACQDCQAHLGDAEVDCR